MGERAEALLRYAMLLNKCKETKGRYSLTEWKIREKWQNAVLCHFSSLCNPL